MSTATTLREHYHHGNLRAALVEAGVQLCREQGPQAIALRPLSRQLGVAPNAVYAHFATLAQLRGAVAERAIELLGEQMERTLADHPTTGDARSQAVQRLRLVGLGYVQFAASEPWLFRLAMQEVPGGQGVDQVCEDGPIAGGDLPGALLRSALEGLIDQGLLRPDKLPEAAGACWAMVHGLGMLSLRDPGDVTSTNIPEQLVESSLDVVVAGLSALA